MLSSRYCCTQVDRRFRDCAFIEGQSSALLQYLAQLIYCIWVKDYFLFTEATSYAWIEFIFECKAVRDSYECNKSTLHSLVGSCKIIKNIVTTPVYKGIYLIYHQDEMKFFPLYEVQDPVCCFTHRQTGKVHLFFLLLIDSKLFCDFKNHLIGATSCNLRIYKKNRDVGFELTCFLCQPIYNASCRCSLTSTRLSK